MANGSLAVRERARFNASLKRKVQLPSLIQINIIFIVEKLMQEQGNAPLNADHTHTHIHIAKTSSWLKQDNERSKIMFKFIAVERQHSSPLKYVYHIVFK